MNPDNVVQLRPPEVEDRRTATLSVWEWSLVVARLEHADSLPEVREIAAVLRSLLKHPSSKERS